MWIRLSSSSSHTSLVFDVSAMLISSWFVSSASTYILRDIKLLSFFLLYLADVLVFPLSLLPTCNNHCILISWSSLFFVFLFSNFFPMLSSLYLIHLPPMKSLNIFKAFISINSLYNILSSHSAVEAMGDTGRILYSINYVSTDLFFLLFLIKP